MASPNYRQAKRQKELLRKTKKQRKQQRRSERSPADTEPVDGGEALGSAVPEAAAAPVTTGKIG